MKSHLDLCSGIGGFALAAQWAGMKTIGFCEIDNWCQSVLRRHWPDTPIWDDIKTLSPEVIQEWIDRNALQAVDLLTAGYPCQPFSSQGQRRGFDDPRHIWPFIAEILRNINPLWCVFENVVGHVAMGIDEVLIEMEEIGYSCWPVVIPAAAVGAPHRRDRVWIIARRESSNYADGDDKEWIFGSAQKSNTEGEINNWPGYIPEGGASSLANANGIGWEEKICDTITIESGHIASSNGGEYRGNINIVQSEGIASTRSNSNEIHLGSMGNKNDGVSGWVVGPGIDNPWKNNWEIGINRTEIEQKDLTKKIHALGNAIVPQVAYRIISAIVATEHGLR